MAEKIGNKQRRVFQNIQADLNLVLKSDLGRNLLDRTVSNGTCAPTYENPKCSKKPTQQLSSWVGFLKKKDQPHSLPINITWSVRGC